MKNSSASPWAVKKLLTGNKNKEYCKRLNSEASILKKLQHPNIVGYRGVFKDINGKKCLAMEQCTSSLGDLIENRSEEDMGAFPPINIFKVAFDMAKALNYLHNTALLLHGDIKSYNILIKDDFNMCKLCDFGTCIPLKSNGCADETSNIPYIGTQSWSAPEVLKIPQQITSKADIFSLGLVFWEMIALQPPLWTENDDIDSIDLCNRTKCRPDLPNENYGPEYNYIFELFYCCTSEDCKNRPASRDLLPIVEEMIKDKKFENLLQ